MSRLIVMPAHAIFGVWLQFTFYLVQRLKSNAVTDLTPGIWNQHPSEDPKQSATKKLKTNSLHLFDIRDTWTTNKCNQDEVVISFSHQVSLVLKRCREFVLSFFVTDCFGSLQMDVNSIFQESNLSQR
ncbi:hypothetical protein J6590_015975 [Homalodisca vitripennis]|nr:hypothetical protein J6590_015975 [Homalodisca vitripennis]